MEADEVPGGSWLCPEVEDGSEFVLPGKLCMLFCDPQEEYGGGRLCAEDGSWAEVLPPHSSILGCGCHMSESCLWQTCRYGNSSQEWSVNCGLEDSGCLAAVAGAGLEAECDEFTGAGDCLLGCEVDILLLLLL